MLQGELLSLLLLVAGAGGVGLETRGGSLDCCSPAASARVRGVMFVLACDAAAHH